MMADNSSLTEERNPRSADLDRLPTLEALRIMNAEDATVPAIVGEALPDIARAVDAIAARMESGGRLIYVGAGTSGRLAMLDAVECVPTFGTPPGRVVALVAGGKPALTRSIEGAEDDYNAGRVDLLALDITVRDAVVGIAASGKTPYVRGALETARAAAILTVAVSCNTPAPLLDIADIGIAAPVGPEVIAGSTRLKAGTAQKMILNMISTAVMVRLGKVYSNLMVDVGITNDKLAARARRIVAAVADVDDAAAGRLLQGAGNDVKTAIIMGMLDLPPAEARDLLKAARGRLRQVIDS